MEASVIVAEGDSRLFVLPKDIVRCHKHVVLLLYLLEVSHHSLILLLGAGRDAVSCGPRHFGGVVGRNAPMVFAEVPVVGHLLLPDILPCDVWAVKGLHLPFYLICLWHGDGQTLAVHISIGLVLETHLVVSHFQHDKVYLSLLSRLRSEGVLLVILPFLLNGFGKFAQGLQLVQFVKDVVRQLLACLPVLLACKPIVQVVDYPVVCLTDEVCLGEIQFQVPEEV